MTCFGIVAIISGRMYEKVFRQIMPRIHKVGRKYNGGEIWNYLTEQEYDWVTHFNKDIHSYNWGIRDGKACLIDYAMSNEVVDRC